MVGKLDRQKIITILLFASISLLVGNIVVSKLSPQKIEKDNTISVKSINDDFEKTLSEFDLKPDWFKKNAVRRKGDDSLKFIYQVRVPKDLPVTVILNEMNLKLKESPLRIASLETKAHKRSRMRIFYGNKLMHETEFVTDTSISRNKPVYGFLIDDVETLSEDELNELLEYPEKYSLMLTPSLESEAMKEKIIKSGREYVLLLKEDIKEVKYRLYEGYTKARLNGSVTNIMKSFGDARLFLLDDFENSNFGEQVLNLFERRRIKIIPFSRYSQISEKDYISLPDDLNNHIKRSPASDIFLISSKDFMKLYGEFKSLRKRGYKFITPSAMNYCI